MDARYFIGISLPPKATKVFNQVKQTFHPNHRLTSPAHITLVAPFYWTNQTLLIGQLTKLAHQFQPFEAKFNHLASFKQPKYGTVYLAPDKVAPFKHMAITLQLAILGQEEKGEFIPHLTLAQKVPHQDIDLVKQKLRDMKLSLKLKVRSFTLFKFDSQSQTWFQFKTFLFQDQVYN